MPNTSRNWWQLIQNLFSLRLFTMSFFSAAIIAVLLSLVWHPLVYLIVPLGLLFWIALAASPTTVLVCPWCKKRVKVGARVCHHCGRVVS